MARRSIVPWIVLAAGVLAIDVAAFFALASLYRSIRSVDLEQWLVLLFAVSVALAVVGIIMMWKQEIASMIPRLKKEAAAVRRRFVSLTSQSATR